MKSDKRFEIVKKNSIGIGRETIILRDKETGVQYLFVSSGYGGGLTPLIDENGKPILDKKEIL